MTSDEIRETYLRFFEERDHRRLPSASLVPAAFDPSVLLTTAGMQPLKPYFQGRELPPHPRLTSCQKCFRAVDIDNIGVTARHLTCFEMLGNFSVGDYFKQGAVEFAWELSTQGFGFDREKIWVTVFEGDDELGLGPDEEAIEAWRSIGFPRERIVLLPRSENFWQAGDTGPCGPSSELYLDRGVAFGAPDDLPGGDNDRFLEFWNLVFMTYDQGPPNTLTPLPAKNIDTGLGLNRLAAILQDTPSVFETDQFRPLIELGEERSGRRYGAAEATDRALRILADHTRGMTFLIADGVVPSNEDRGYVLRRIMRRAIFQGRRLGFEPGFLIAFAQRVRELMGGAYRELDREWAAIDRWVRGEEESFTRTLDQGTRRLEELIERARERGAEGIAADDAFALHDTHGFPFDLTRELVAEQGLGVDEEGFETRMDEQRARARAAGGRAHAAVSAVELSPPAPPSAFTGYEVLEQHSTVASVGEQDGRVLVKLAESPFYAAGGGQVADTGEIACEGGDCRATVADVLRVGDDQAVVVEPAEGALAPGERVVARVDAPARHATACNHTATHLLHAALRRVLGDHVRQAGSYVGPDKLRFDFTHGGALADEDRRQVEDLVNEWVLRNDRVRALETTLDEARALGAMALFGEKYGDVVRMVEVGDGSYSRELCGGTHVRSTAEIGLFKLTSEGSSAANVRRVEALTGPAAVALLRHHDDLLGRTASAVRSSVEDVPARVGDLQAQLKEARRRPSGVNGQVDAAELAGRAVEIAGAPVLAEAVPGGDPKALMELADRVKGKLGDAAVVLGTAGDGRVHLVAAVAPALVERGVKAGAVVKAAAQVAGGGG
ncbi:MAG: alanine--tRNA ligase, partial [Actinomycetota bacterium]|nr:alanine--tRNA ligase [Actinomycetota bacterium]